MLTVGLAAGPLVGIVVYSAVHEAGHALVAVANGAQVDRFVVGPNAHVAWSGGSFSAAATSLSHAAGALLPTLLLVVALAAYRSRARSDVYHTLYAVLTACTIGSLLAWVVIPVVAAVGTPPPGDDVTRLLESSGMPPLALGGIATATLAGLVTLAVWRRVPQTWVRILREVAAEEKAARASELDVETAR